MSQNTYEDYYREYLGLFSQESQLSHVVIQSKYRDLPINNKHYYPVIISQINDTKVCSCSEKYYELCKCSFDGTIESLQNSRFQWSKLHRYSISESNDYTPNLVLPLNESLLRSVSFNIHNDIEAYIESKRDILSDARQFAYIENHRILSTAFISDIYCSGCNIVVYTDPDFRSKGYGRQTVNACINWCLSNRLLPIYLVEETNTSSIRLAEALGFKLMNTEWALMEIERNPI